MQSERLNIANNRIEPDEVWRVRAPYLAAHAERWADEEK